MASLMPVAERVILAGEHVRPLWLRRWLFAALFSLYLQLRRVQALLFQLRVSVSTVIGESKDDERLCLFFVGPVKFPEYLSNLLFKYPPRIEYGETTWIWRLKHIAREAPAQINGVIVSCDRFYQKWVEQAGFYVFPYFVDMVLDVSDSPEDFFRKSIRSVKNEIRKVRKYGYSFEVYSDIDHLRFFYDRMYLPLIRTRHRKAPLYTPPFFFLRWLLLTGYRLVFLKDDRGNDIAGCFYRVNHGEALARYLGVIDGDIELIRRGAESALYYFFVSHPENPELCKVNFGGARPFFSNGLLLYKKKWGMTVEICDYTPEIFGLRLMIDSEPFRMFLLNNPFISFNDKKELEGCVFIDKDSYTDVFSRDLEKRYQIPGITGFRFIRL